MSSVIIERSFEESLTTDIVRSMAEELSPCMGIYSVTWQESWLSKNGNKMICHFDAPDAEALRNTFRRNNTPVKVLYPCTLHDTGNSGSVNVVVERSWSEPVNMDDIAAIEEAGSWCLEAHDVTFIRTFFSRDRKRMVCLYQAPDAESVRMSQNKAKMPFDQVWPLQHLTPATLFG